MRRAFASIGIALVAAGCALLGPGTPSAPDPVGSDTSADALLAEFASLPAPSDRSPFLTPVPPLVASADLMVPPGFVAERLLPPDALPRATSLAFRRDGVLAVSSERGILWTVDLATREVRELARGFTVPLGVLWVDDALYVSDNGTVWRLAGGERSAVVRGVPVGQHQTDGVALGPDGRIYLSVGSTCNACRERDPRSGSIVRFPRAGGEVEVFAGGFRNPYDLAFHPRDGSLWVTDNGRDDLGAAVPDELNLVQQGKRYGWPECYGTGRGAECSGTVQPLVELDANSSSNGIAFYTGTSFPERFRDNIFIAQWGSFRRTRGRKVVRVVAVKRAGRYEARAVDFATGFDAPLDLAVGPADGALYVVDHGTGALYRIRWQG